MNTAERCATVLRRVPAGVTVVAAAKGRTPEEIREAIRAGISHIGENYVQDAEAKRALVSEPATWHMIGRLQRNKASKAADTFDWVQTVDSIELAERLDAAAARAGRTLPILVQVNIGREPRKAGALPEAAPSLVAELSRFAHLAVRGLMAIPPLPERSEDSRPYFRALRQLRDEINRDRSGNVLDVLSIGMSADWEVAVDEGATMIRLGTVLFGPRPWTP
jgi:pyridoxal phosphate enzyme (YggS family)